MRSVVRCILLFAILSQSCTPREKADSVLIHAKIYTADSAMSVMNWVAVKDGKILSVGSGDNFKSQISDQTIIFDLEGAFLYPGFEEGHAHLMGVGFNKINVDLSAAMNYEEVVGLVEARSAGTPAGTWIVGRGWHQEKWGGGKEFYIKGFPTHHALSEAVPNHPVFLSHASGHAALVNQKALDILGITKSTPQPDGGEIFIGMDGTLTGILNESAQDIAERAARESLKAQYPEALRLAIQECHRHGITSFHDAGEDSLAIDLYKQFLSESILDLRLYSMLSATDTLQLERFFKTGPFYDSLDRLTVRSVKLYSDGALGSRGAWLLDEYTDAPGIFGHNVTPLERIEYIASEAYRAGFQVCTHAIGDRANREVLDIYERVLSGDQTSRFRIEHAQHIHPEDIPRFSEMGIIPAMQAIHMSSDRPWAIDRLGKERVESGAYVWRSLIDSGSRIINGTDAPVESISPLASFYASVSRKTLSGIPEGGYEPAQKMTREEALRSYTSWPAYGAFLEEKTGSIEIGKYADFVVLDRDIMTIPEADLLSTTVLMTFFGGKVVYEKTPRTN